MSLHFWLQMIIDPPQDFAKLPLTNIFGLHWPLHCFIAGCSFPPGWWRASCTSCCAFFFGCSFSTRLMLLDPILSSKMWWCWVLCGEGSKIYRVYMNIKWTNGSIWELCITDATLVYASKRSGTESECHTHTHVPCAWAHARCCGMSPNNYPWRFWKIFLHFSWGSVWLKGSVITSASPENRHDHQNRWFWSTLKTPYWNSRKIIRRCWHNMNQNVQDHWPGALLVWGLKFDDYATARLSEHVVIFGIPGMLVNDIQHLQVSYHIDFVCS